MAGSVAHINHDRIEVLPAISKIVLQSGKRLVKVPMILGSDNEPIFTTYAPIFNECTNLRYKRRVISDGLLLLGCSRSNMNWSRAGFTVTDEAIKCMNRCLEMTENGEDLSSFVQHVASSENDPVSIPKNRPTLLPQPSTSAKGAGDKPE